MTFGRPRLHGVALALCLVLAACGSPITVERQDARAVRTELTSNALTTGRLSQATQTAMRRLDVLTLFDRDPLAALRVVNQAVIANRGHPDLMFALAEMAFVHGERANDRAYFLATVVYAYGFLFPAQPALRPDPFDPRLRTAADLYNLALTRALATADGAFVELRAGEYALPFGTLAIRHDPSSARWAGRALKDFVPVGVLQVRGMQNRYRETGIGAPLAAAIEPVAEGAGMQVAPNLKVPVTAVLRLDVDNDAILRGRFSGELVLFPGNEHRRIDIGGQSVPLEIEPSAALAYTLAHSTVWRSELEGFLQGDLFDTMPTQLFGVEPYRPGRIPVVLVHGTASSAGRWADMLNDLENDPDIRDRFQFWLFAYNTGNPIPLSALKLRQALAATVARLDPGRRDPALHRMVVVGHSQGGLLSKMLVIDPGSRLFDAFSTRPLEELRFSPETRETLRDAFFIQPLPDVSRVVFIATPHHGSFRTSLSLARLVGRFITLPLGVTRMVAETLTGNADALRFDPGNLTLGSLYGMAPGSPLISTLSAIPVAPTVAAHSIIAVEGDGPVETGDDGVVEYRSAHIEEAQSELVVRSGHSVQANPKTVAEVKRILLLHWAQSCPDGCYPADAARPPPATRRPGGVVSRR